MTMTTISGDELFLSADRIAAEAGLGGLAWERPDESGFRALPCPDEEVARAIVAQLETLRRDPRLGRICLSQADWEDGRMWTIEMRFALPTAVGSATTN